MLGADVEDGTVSYIKEAVGTRRMGVKAAPHRLMKPLLALAALGRMTYSHRGKLGVSTVSTVRSRVSSQLGAFCRQITDEFRKSYALLWQSLIFADAEGIKEHSQAMNAGDMYPLFAGMLTNRPWDEVGTGCHTCERMQTCINS